MMSILGYVCMLYTMDNLPENVFLAILMLLPFFVGAAALTMEAELLTKMQLACVGTSYVGILLLTNPQAFIKENRAKLFIWDDVRPWLVENWLTLLCAIAANTFQAFNFIAARRISRTVHSCIETMYIGIVSMLVYSIGLCFIKPSYFKFWAPQYTVEQLLYTVVTSLLYYASQESLSAALAHLKSGAVATFTYVSVLITFLGYKFFKLVLYKKALLGKSRDEILLWLAESDENLDMLHDTEIKREEICGMALIFISVGILFVSLRDDPEIVVNGKKSREGLRAAHADCEGPLCQKCKAKSKHE